MHHSGFWTDLQRHVVIEEPSPVDRCLGRKHLVKREDGVTTFACEAYTSLTGQNLKEALSPYVAHGNLCETD